MGQMVLDDLWKVIDKRFPLVEIPSALERERTEHEAFAGLRTRVYVGRQEYYDRLNEGGSRRGTIPQVRGEIANSLVDKYGLPLAEVARQVGVLTSAISKALGRAEK